VTACWANHLEQVCTSWRRTPWQAGQCRRGVAVDCVRFVDAVLMQLHGYCLPPLPRLAQDQPLHDRRGVMRATHQICRRYPHAKLRPSPSLELEPGDVLIVARGDAPGHVGIVGADVRTMWHALYGHHVCASPVKQVGDVVRVYRPSGKQTWRPCVKAIDPARDTNVAVRRRPCKGCH
jgi:cell wall-associated NlpC family hydrolase